MEKWQSEWDDGKLSVTYDGEGNGTAAFSATPNEGVDRTTAVTFVDDRRKLRVKVAVMQEGLREVLECSDGRFFRVKKNKIFEVLKRK